MRKTMFVVGASLVVLALLFVGAWRVGKRFAHRPDRARHMTVNLPAASQAAAPFQGEVLVDLPYAPGPSDPPPPLPSSAKSLTPVEWTRQLRNAMCACADAACVRAVDLRYRNMGVELSAEDTEVVRKTIHETSRCQQHILDGRPLDG